MVHMGTKNLEAKQVAVRSYDYSAMCCSCMLVVERPVMCLPMIFGGWEM